MTTTPVQQGHRRHGYILSQSQHDIMEERLLAETIYCREANLTNEETERYLASWDIINTEYLAEAPTIYDSRGHAMTNFALPWTASIIHFYNRT